MQFFIEIKNLGIFLFFRYSNKENATPESPTEERSDPPQFAETCMRELVGRASFGHIRCVIKPVLKHLDNHQLWVPNYFAIHTFRIIMFSIQVTNLVYPFKNIN